MESTAPTAALSALEVSRHLLAQKEEKLLERQQKAEDMMLYVINSVKNQGGRHTFRFNGGAIEVAHSCGSEVWGQWHRLPADFQERLRGLGYIVKVTGFSFFKQLKVGIPA